MDVVPTADRGWLASCDCGRSERFAEQELAWHWLIDHECARNERPAVLSG